MTAAIATLTSKGQITLPKNMRDDLRLKAGDKVVFVKTNDSWKLASTTGSPREILAYLGRDLNDSGIDWHKEFEEGWDDPER